MAFIRQRIGQSVYDLCLQAYGTLDLLIKFCTDNNISDLEEIVEQADYYYDPALVKFEGNSNIYVTDFADVVQEQEGNYYVTEGKTARYVSSDGYNYIYN